MYVGLHIKYPLFLSYIHRVVQNSQISNFMKIPAVGADLFRADGRTTDRQTDITKLIGAFHNITKVLKGT